MKISCLIIVAVLLGAVPALARLPARLEAKPIPTFVAPPVSTRVLANGLTLYLMHDPSLPVVRFHAIVGYGSLTDPPGKEGLAQILMDSLRLGGTERLSPRELDSFLDTRSASLATNAKAETAFIEIGGLAEDSRELLHLLVDLMRHPRHDPALLKTEKKRAIEEVRRRYDDPFNVASIVFQRLLYGESSPWVAMATAKSIRKVERDALLTLQGRYFVPSNIRLLVWGDFDAKGLVAQLEPLTGDWHGETVHFPYPPKLAKKIFHPGVYLVPRKIPQPVMLFGHLGERRFSPDKYNLLVGNWILGGGGGGTSRLNKKIREEKGYAYMVGSRFTFETEYGQCGVYLQTSEGKVVEALREALTQFKLFVADPQLTKTEIDEAKQAFVASLLFEADSTFGFALKTMQFDTFGYPPKYLEVFRREILQVGAPGIRDAVTRQIFPDQATIVVVGDPKKLKGPLAAFGPVHIIKPPPP